MNNTTKFIHKTVYENAIIADTKARWQEYRHNVRKRLEQLQPAKMAVRIVWRLMLVVASHV